MKLRSQLASALVFLYAMITLSAAPKYSTNHNTINAVLGDISFVKKFGKAPNESTNERLRIQTHLAYVEALLRMADVSHLSPTLRERRWVLLDKLHDYRLAGEFPTNLDFPQERRPCFIDAAGNICAVGYLIEQTAGRTLAERITEAHKYDFLADMAMPELTAWVEASGLTARECAMIQPAYRPPVISTNGYGIVITNPLTISANYIPEFIRIRLIGLPQSTLTSCPSTQIYLLFENPIVKYLKASRPECTTTATASSIYWDIYASFPLNQLDITAATYQVRVLCEDIFTGDRYYSRSTTFTVSPATSTRDLTLPSPITISPNPTNDVCMLALPENELHRVRLTNSLGTAVATLSEATGTTALDVSGLSAGVYFVEVESRTTRRRWVQKMVKY